MGPDLILIFCIGTLEWTNLISSQPSSAFCYDKRFLYYEVTTWKSLKDSVQMKHCSTGSKFLRPFSKAFFYLSILATFFWRGGASKFWNFWVGPFLSRKFRFKSDSLPFIGGIRYQTRRFSEGNDFSRKKNFLAGNRNANCRLRGSWARKTNTFDLGHKSSRDSR